MFQEGPYCTLILLRDIIKGKNMELKIQRVISLIVIDTRWVVKFIDLFYSSNGEMESKNIKAIQYHREKKKNSAGGTEVTL